MRVCVRAHQLLVAQRRRVSRRGGPHLPERGPTARRGPRDAGPLPRASFGGAAAPGTLAVAVEAPRPRAQPRVYLLEEQSVRRRRTRKKRNRSER